MSLSTSRSHIFAGIELEHAVAPIRTTIMSEPQTMSIAMLASPGELEEGKTYTGMRVQVRDHRGETSVWENVQGRFVYRDAPGYAGGTVRAIFLYRTFPGGQVVQVGLNSRARTVRVEFDGAWHTITRLLDPSPERRAGECC